MRRHRYFFALLAGLAILSAVPAGADIGGVALIYVQCSVDGTELCSPCDAPRYRRDGVCVILNTSPYFILYDGFEHTQIHRGTGTIGIDSLVYHQQGLASFVWDQTDQDGKQVEPGFYTVFAIAHIPGTTTPELQIGISTRTFEIVRQEPPEKNAEAFCEGIAFCLDSLGDDPDPSIRSKLEIGRCGQLAVECGPHLQAVCNSVGACINKIEALVGNPKISEEDEAILNDVLACVLVQREYFCNG